ncbi:MAG TPA: aminotransferase class I/II-fold pyridoxal phosphate-dependent enzyme, partial [Acidimicrobiales bacterium]|nr:aminotransferase class I/II-fold pyridoxal phosphate-dependent enzyme [Acidimicrobiales bacterium]
MRVVTQQLSTIPERDLPPLARHLVDVRDAETTSFHMPAHKGGAGAPPAGVELLGAAAYDADVSEMGGFDYLHDAGAALSGAQARAAALFGADSTRFLVNGATVGNIAAVMSTVSDGDVILVARGSHRSTYAGITLSGAHPIYLAPLANPRLDGLFGIAVDDVASALDTHPEIKAVHLTNPSYYGFTVDIAAVATITSAAGIPLIVDEAHGSHWALDSRFPAPALSAGADLVIQSPHKTLGSLTQSSLIHVSGDRVDGAALDGHLQMLQSSSPSSLLLVSLDVAIDEMARHGKTRWAGAIALADELRVSINAHRGLTAYGEEEIVDTPGIVGFDPTKVVVDVHRLATTGFAAGAWLRAHTGLNPEFADLRRMVFSVTYADDRRSTGLLADALGRLAHSSPVGAPIDTLVSRWPVSIPEMVCTPRVGSSSGSQRVPLADAIGRTCAEMVVPYPPGVPLLVPGERISTEVVAAI